MEYVIGKSYKVPCVQVTGYLNWANLHDWIPVLLPKHNDKETINFPHEHYHIDWRFAPVKHWNSVRDNRMGDPGTFAINFDSRVLHASDVGFGVSGSQYDILRELWVFDGLDPDNFNPRTHGGYGLDACTQANFGIGKSGNGAMAPVDWQKGKIGKTISYCLRDVMLTKMLFDKIRTSYRIVNPKTSAEIRLPNPLAPRMEKANNEMAW